MKVNQRGEGSGCQSSPVVLRTIILMAVGLSFLFSDAAICTGQSAGIQAALSNNQQVGISVGASAAPSKAAKFRPDRILVKPKKGLKAVHLASQHAALGARVERTFAAIGDLQIVKLPPGLTVEQAINRYQRSGLAEYAEPDYEVHAFLSPNDPRYTDGTLWAMHNYCQNGCTPGVDIHAEEAWDIRTSANPIIVAVIDTGVRYTHEDLAANIWSNTCVSCPVNGIVYTNDYYGINAITDTGDPLDDAGHGTHVAGTIGAVGNNGKGVVGVAWNVRIMALKFLDYSVSGYTSDGIKCIDYAIAKGANIINASWGSDYYSSPLRDAVIAARAADIIFVAAAGNWGEDNDIFPQYPASYDVDNIVAVAATDCNDQMPDWSDYGQDTVDLGAPGVDIYSCLNGSDSDYGLDSGTSMAAPHVSGALALLRAQFPELTYSAAISELLATTDPIPSLAGMTVTGGRLNLQKLLLHYADVWTGATSSDWETNTVNWVFSGNPTNYYQADFVYFDDTATNSAGIVNLTMTLTPTNVAVNNNTINYTFNGSGRLSGSGRLIKLGSGALTINNTGTNDFSGGFRISGGTVQIGQGDGNNDQTGSVGAGNVINDSVLVFNRGDNLVITNSISGSGMLTKTGPGTLVLTGSNTYSGPTTVSNGALVVVPSATSTNYYGCPTPSMNVWTVVPNNGLIFSNGTPNEVFAVGALAGPGGFTLVDAANGDPITLRINSAPGLNTTFSGNLTGSGGIIKEGLGVLTLSGTNTYTGGTTIAQGLLEFGCSNAVPTAGTLAISNGALVELFFTGIQAMINNLSPSTAGAIAILAASANENVNFAVPGVANVWFVAAQTLTYGGTYTPFTNAYRLGAYAGQTLYYTNLLVDLYSLPTGLNIGSFGGGTVALFANLGAVSNALLIVTNSYSGGTTVLGDVNAWSTLYIADDHNLGGPATLTLSNASLEATNSFTLNNRPIVLQDSSGIGVDPFSRLTVTNLVSGQGPLIKYRAGVLVLSANNTYSGGTMLNEGVLAYGNAGAVPKDSSVTVSKGAVGFMFTNIQASLGAVIANGNGVNPSLGGVALFATNVNDNINFTAANLLDMSLVAAENLTYGGTYTPYDHGDGGRYRLGAMAGATLTYTNTIVDATDGPSFLVIGGFSGAFGGTVFLTASNSYTGGGGGAPASGEGFGATALMGGTLYITNEAALGGPGIGGTDPRNVFVGGLMFSNATLRTTNTFTLNNRLVQLMGDATFNVEPGSMLVITNTIQYSGPTNISGVSMNQVSLTKTNSGLLILTGTNNYPPGAIKINVYINGGVLRAAQGTGINFFPPTDTGTESNSNAYIDGGVWEVTSGLLTNRVTALQGSGGLAFGNGGSGSGLSAYGTNLVVWLGTDATATDTTNPSNVSTQQWGSGNFNPTVLILNESTANTNLEWLNHIDLNAATTGVTTRTIAVNATNPLMTRIFGRIMNSTTTNFPTTSVGGLTKTGVGTLELETNNSYNGATTINLGTLRLGSVGSITNSMFIVVGVSAASNACFDVSGVTGGPYAIGGATNQTLAGFGSMIGNVTLTNAGSLAPGDTATTTNYLIGSVTNAVSVLASGVGTLTFSNDLTVVSINTLFFDLGTNSDLVQVLGNLTVGGTLNVRDSGGFTNTTYTLFTYGGTLTYNGVTIGSTPNPSLLYTVNTNTSGQVKLVVAPCTPPWADFLVNTTTGAAPLQAIFTDTSTGTINNVTWTFGDGNSVTNAAATTVTNTYATGGHYSVTQIVDSASCGISTNGQPNLIWVYTPWEIWQNKYFGCIGCQQAAGNVDADGDGINNSNEFLAGTDPTNSMSALRIISVVRQAGTNIVITWTAVGGKSYVVQTNAPAANGSYTNNFGDLSSPITVPGNGGDTTAVYTNWAGATNVPSLYYRIRLGP